jgi:hypothetical protein
MEVGSYGLRPSEPPDDLWKDFESLHQLIAIDSEGYIVMVLQE